jgi:molecular chaperone HscA
MSLVNIEEPNKNQTISKCLGIDFGTTNSVCSIKLDDKVIFIDDSHKKTLIPTALLFKKEIVIGNDIDFKKNIQDCVFSIKRNFVKNPDKKMLFNNNLEMSPVEISKEFFLYLKKMTKKFLKEDLSDCVLTVPAYFDERARSGIMRSALMAGFNVRRLINEPTAAAFAYGLDAKKRGNFLVYDLGGGTFDVSLLKLKDKLFKVVGTSGDANLGGDDFDNLILEELILKDLKIKKEDIADNVLKVLLKEAKLIKERSQETKNFTASLIINGEKKEINVNSCKIDEILEELVEKTITITSELLNDCEAEINEIDGFILVGGSTRVKLITKKLEEKFRKKIFNELDPDHVVSYGASLHGFELLNGSDNLLLDVTPLSLGIETMGGLMEKIIPRNSNIPTVKEQVFTTNENGQTSIKISVLQGEREISKNNTFLGELILSNLEPKPAGIPRVKVRFSLDADGILFVSAIDESTGNEQNSVIKTGIDLSVEEMKKIVESSIENAKEDMDTRSLIESKIKATRLINEINNVKREIQNLCSKKDIEKIYNITNMLNNELKKNNKVEIDNLVENLNDVTKSFAEKIVNKNFKNFVGKDIDILEQK